MTDPVPEAPESKSRFRRFLQALGTPHIGGVIALVGVLLAFIGVLIASVSATTDVLNFRGSDGTSSSETAAAGSRSAPPTGVASVGPPVALVVKATRPREVAVTAEVNRPARAGHSYWFVLEVHEVSGTHSEWYPRQVLVGTQEFTLAIPEDADATRRRTGTVFEVTD